jgi:predicted nuclease with TOPRIM domain
MKSFFRAIGGRFYLSPKVLKEQILELLKAILLIFFFHFGLYWLSETYGWNVYPHSKVGYVLLFSFTAVIFTSWFFGRRHLNLLIFSYLVTFQIVGLAFVLHDWTVVPRLLLPTFLTYLSLFLFKSPGEYLSELKEKQIEEIYSRIKKLKSQISQYRQILKEIKDRYNQLLKEKQNLEQNLKNLNKEELEENLKKKEELVKEYEKRIAELNEKISKLKSTNAQLWEMLEETLDNDQLSGGKQKELKKLRKERKKLIKENLQLKQELDDLRAYLKMLEQDLELKEEENKLLLNQLEELNKKIDTYQQQVNKYENLLSKDWLSVLNLVWDKINFTPQALADFTELTPKEKIQFIKALKKLDKTDLSNHKAESLTISDQTVFKGRFSGGRFYYQISNGRFEILGILQGEDEKSKDRFIRERFN